jgi:hypothetical protein
MSIQDIFYPYKTLENQIEINFKSLNENSKFNNNILNFYEIDNEDKINLKVTAKIDNIALPTKEEEEQNLLKADEIYDSCTKYLISKTRDTTKYNLLFKENTSYGFRRNLWGMKTWAIVILFVSTIVHLILATDFFSNYSFKPNKDAYLYVGFLMVFIFWIFIVTPNWIRIVADEYAKRLYETLEE